jgi:hypothetical protein
MRRCAALSVPYAFGFGLASLALRIYRWGGVRGNWRLHVLFMGMMTVCGVVGYLTNGSRLSFGVPALGVLFVVVVSLVDLSPVEPALRAVAHVQPGMTESQVRDVVREQFPAGGRFRLPESSTLQAGMLWYVLDRDDPRYNSAFIEVHFEQGRCIDARFLAD